MKMIVDLLHFDFDAKMVEWEPSMSAFIPFLSLWLHSTLRELMLRLAYAVAQSSEIIGL